MTHDEPKRSAYREHCDPRLLARLDRYEQKLPSRDYRIGSPARPIRTHLDPADWRAGFLAVRDGGRPDEIASCMYEQAPQALLRDLFRPVFELQPIDWRFRDSYGARAAAESYRELKTILHRRESVPRIEPSLAIWSRQRLNWLARMNVPWKPHRPDDAPRQYTSLIPYYTG